MAAGFIDTAWISGTASLDNARGVKRGAYIYRLEVSGDPISDYAVSVARDIQAQVAAVTAHFSGGGVWKPVEGQESSGVKEESDIVRIVMLSLLALAGVGAFVAGLWRGGSAQHDADDQPPH